MEIALGAFLLIMFIITWVVIACNAPSSCPLPHYRELGWEPDFSKSRLETENQYLKDKLIVREQEIDQLKRHYRSCLHTCGCHCENRVIYAKSPDEQKIVDLLTKGMKPLAELQKELGIKPN